MSGTATNSPTGPSADPQEIAIQALESATLPEGGFEYFPQKFQWLNSFLKQINPDVDDAVLLRVVSAVFKKLPDENGLELAIRWCTRGGATARRSRVDEIWRTQTSSSEDTGTHEVFSALASENIDANVTLELDPTSTSTSAIDLSALPEVRIKTAVGPLDKYSIQNILPTLEALAITMCAIFGQLVLMGQFTIIFAAPNTGKTLLMLFLLIEAIQQKRIDPGNVYYINMDDNATGLIEKARIALEFGFNIVAEGYQDFSVKNFAIEIAAMTERNQVSGTVIVLDTYKKFANVMDKTQTSQFNKLLRRFVMKGGTVVALAHTNKNMGANGKPVYGGTTDSLDDCDCAYILRTIQPQVNANEKLVEFDNIKRRGNVVQSAGYRYSTDPDISYSELLASVQPVSDPELAPLKQAESFLADATIVSAVETCIRAGLNTKMMLAAAVAERVGRSKRAVIRIIEKYSGDDPLVHRWTYSVRERGSQVFVPPRSRAAATKRDSNVAPTALTIGAGSAPAFQIRTFPAPQDARQPSGT